VALALYVDMATGRGAEQGCAALELRDADAASVADQMVDGEVAHEIALLLAAQAKEEAVRLSRQGDHAAAAGVLASASQTLRAGPYAASPLVAGEIGALAQFAAEADQGLDEHQRKELRYQSYLTREARQRYDQ
jgi:Ca-activated chloride channel family protein